MLKVTFLQKTPKERKYKMLHHMQQISSDIQTPVMKLKRAKPNINQTLQSSIQLVFG